MVSPAKSPEPPTRRRKKVGISAAQRLRLRFMESVVVWEGAVYRKRLVTAFGVTENHISRDFKQYLHEYPNSLAYDLSRKRYLPGHAFKPRYASGSTGEYLGLLRTHCEATDVTDTQLPGLPGPTAAETVPLQGGGVDAETLQAITRAITDGTGLEASYQSMSRPAPMTAQLWPHAMVFSGSRWHARAFHQAENRFADFVLPRLTVKHVIPETPAAAGSENDAAWNALVAIAIQPAAHLSPAQQDAIAKEYGMGGKPGRWVWSCRLRECVAPYFLHLHRLDIKERKPRIELVDPTLRERYRFPDA